MFGCINNICIQLKLKDVVFANDGLEKDSWQQEDGDTIRLLSAHVC